VIQPHRSLNLDSPLGATPSLGLRPVVQPPILTETSTRLELPQAVQQPGDRCTCCGSPFPKPHSHRNCAKCLLNDGDNEDD